MKDLDGGQSCIPVAKKYGVAKKSFALLEKKAEILKQMKEAERRVSKKRKRIKTATYKELDSGMYKWLKSARHSNIPINCNLSKEKAVKIAKLL